MGSNDIPRHQKGQPTGGQFAAKAAAAPAVSLGAVGSDGQVWSQRQLALSVLSEESGLRGYCEVTDHPDTVRFVDGRDGRAYEITMFEKGAFGVSAATKAGRVERTVRWESARGGELKEGVDHIRGRAVRADALHDAAAELGISGDVDGIHLPQGEDDAFAINVFDDGDDGVYFITPDGDGVAVHYEGEEEPANKRDAVLTRAFGTTDGKQARSMADRLVALTQRKYDEAIAE